eukprot:3729014-Pyramimonas_sp.AAC.1
MGGLWCSHLVCFPLFCWDMGAAFLGRRYKHSCWFRGHCPLCQRRQTTDFLSPPSFMMRESLFPPPVFSPLGFPSLADLLFLNPSMILSPVLQHLVRDPSQQPFVRLHALSVVIIAVVLHCKSHCHARALLHLFVEVCLYGGPEGLVGVLHL